MSDSFVARPRLLEILASATGRVTLAEAPPGFGASTLVRRYAQDTGGVYVCLLEGTTLARFAGDLVEAVGIFLPGIRETLAGAYERALRAPAPPEALAAWFARYAYGLAATIAIDQLQHAADASVTRFVIRAIELTPESCRWILTSTNLDDLPVASWLAHRLANVPLDEHDFALTPNEALAFARAVIPTIAPAAAAELHAFTRGRVADFAFLLRAQEQSGMQRRLGHASVHELLDAIFRSFTPQQKDFAVRSCLLPALAPEMVAAVAGREGNVTLGILLENEAELFEDGGLRFQSRFKAFLRARLSTWSRRRQAFVALRTATVLESAGDIAAALHLFITLRYQSGILRLIERHGFSSLESGNASLVHDAIGALDEEAREHNFAVLTLRAMSASLLGTSDVAESLFQHAIAACVTPEQATRVRLLYANELLRRGRPDALALLKPDAELLNVPPELRVGVMSSLGVAFAIAGNLGEAEKWTQRALRAGSALNDDILAARVRHSAAWVALQGGHGVLATELATAAVELAERAGAYEVASGACSVLYQIAMDFEDDPRNAETYLERIALYGSKCGNIEKQIFALVAAYEIQVESGKGAAAIAIERSLGEFDVQYGAHIISEALVSAQVLQLAWSGDFKGAHKTLGFSADQQWTPDREALRWAEIAVYAAAGGAPEKSAGAVVSALRKLKFAPRDSVRALRARLFCALAFVLLGRTAAPRMMLAAVGRDLPASRGRLRTLASAIEGLAAYRAGDEDHEAMLKALEALHECEFGGVARMLEALPLEVLQMALPAAAARA